MRNTFVYKYVCKYISIITISSVGLESSGAEINKLNLIRRSLNFDQKGLKQFFFENLMKIIKEDLNEEY